MARVGSLVVDLVAQTASFNTNISKAASQLNSNAARMNRSLATIESKVALVGKGFVALAGTAGIGLGVGALVQAGRAALQHADDLATAADQAGISVERYQTLNEALRTLELSSDQTTKVLKILNETLGAAQLGQSTKEVADALKRLGVEQGIANGTITTGDQLLDGIAKGATGYANQAQFASDITAVFGRRLGVDLAAALKDGGVALKGLEADFLATGKVIDQEMITKLADANEVIDRFAASSKQSLTLWAGETISALTAVGKQFGFFLSRTEEIEKRLRQIRGGREVSTEMLGGLITFTRPANDTRERDALLDDWLKSLPLTGGGDFRGGFELPKPKLPSERPDASGGTSGRSRAKDPAADALAFARSLVPVEGALAKYNEGMATLNAGLKAGEISQDLYAAATQRLFDEVTQLPEGIEQVLPSFTEMGDVLEMMGVKGVEAAQALQFEIERLKDPFHGLSEIAPDIAHSFGYFFESAILGFNSVGDAVRGLIADLAQLALRQFVTKPLMGAISSALGGGALGFATGGFVSGPGGPRSDSIPAMLSNGEFVLNARAVERLGVPFLNSLNMGAPQVPAFAAGGLVGRSFGGGEYQASRGPTWNVNVTVNGPISDREARRSGMQIAAGMQREQAKAAKRGFAA